jgi:xylulose-5-phosphate/fructose-6-phosphate phosphoketolase
MDTQPMPASDREELTHIDAWWRAANYLAIGQIYLLDNPLLREKLTRAHIKPRLLGHWGTTPGLAFLYVHLNRIIRHRDIDAIFIAGPGHGAPAVVASTWLDGTYSEVYPHVGQNGAGMRHLFRQFSFPGGIPSHASPDTPGSIHEGGELGYSLSHAFGAAFDNPGLVVACVVGDGEAETGPLATSWHGGKFLRPGRDGAVLPILHLNGYKIANPTILARMPHGELAGLLRGYGYDPIFVEGHEPEPMHAAMAAAMDRAFDAIADIQAAGRAGRQPPRWPMIVLRAPKGWTCPAEVDGHRMEGSWRAHQVPFEIDSDAHLALLESWMRSYRPEELFDADGAPVAAIRALAPQGAKRMSASPHANGGLLMRPLELPDPAVHALTVTAPGAGDGEATRVMGLFLRDVMAANLASANFRLFGPDETVSNRLGAVLEVTPRAWEEAILPEDADGGHLGVDGRVMEILSEHTCQGWLEGYLLTGRHGLFSCYEAFIHIVDSMVNQHAKWLKAAREIPWRRPIASLNYLLTSHVWRQDHNGFSHQDPGFVDHVVNKKAEIVRVYMPPDANTLLWVTEHCLSTWDRINVIVCGKQKSPQWLDYEAAASHCAAGAGIWTWASNDAGATPDVVMACAGDVPTYETMAAVDFLRHHVPELRVRVVNVVDLMALQAPSQHPHGLSDADFDSLFTTDRPVIFAYHGYPTLIHRLTYKRRDHDNFHVHGYEEEGSTTTPFDMTVRNRLDRFHLAEDALARAPGLGARADHARQHLRDLLSAHTRYIAAHGEDMPEVRDWRWTGGGGGAAGIDDTGRDDPSV